MIFVRVTICGSITLLTFRSVNLGGKDRQLPGMTIIAPLAFVISSMVIFWVPWDQLVKTAPIMAIAIKWFVVTHVHDNHGTREITGGIWLVVYLAFLYVLSYFGSFGGRGIIPSPWGSVIAAVGGLVIYFWGLKAGTEYMRGDPDTIEALRRSTALHESDETSEMPDTS